MKTNFLLPLFSLLTAFGLQAQVTQINSNKSLSFHFPLSNNSAIFVSNADQTIWVTNGTLTGTTQLSLDIKFVADLGSPTFLSGKFIFVGSTNATGNEVYITDGTPGGTILVKDINPGATGSSPSNDVALLNGFLYFTAETPAEGRELWRTDGTGAGTTLVKDIVPGSGGSNYPNNYHLLSTGTYLLFAARTPSSGVELWRSDGTGAGTFLLKDINTHNADSSGVQLFFGFNNLVLFQANDFDHGFETWKTDGTPGGTVLLKDINTGTAGSKPLISTGYYFIFNGRAYFTANDGVNGEEIWSTDGTDAGTSLLQNIEPGAGNSTDWLFDAVIVGNKFIFPSANLFSTRRQLWESDGTTAGTKLFKDFDGGKFAFIFPLYNGNTQTVNHVLFQGNKFFFAAGTVAEGNELWVSDGTIANTHIVKDINPGTANGFDQFSNYTHIYTSTALYFGANNGTNGRELWKSDGTPGGTSMVADIVTGLGSSEPIVEFFIVNGKILFQANNGDNPILTDLYAVDGSFTPLPIFLAEFTVTTVSSDAILNWRTLQELNSKNFTIERSFDGLNFQNIGTVSASGTSSIGHSYTFTDVGIMNSGKTTVYYRLLATDVDGKSSISPVVTLKLAGTAKWNVRLLTNPVNENMKVQLSGITENVQLSIIDMSGKKHYTSSLSAVNGQISLPVARLPDGTYMLLTETGNERKTIRFVK